MTKIKYFIAIIFSIILIMLLQNKVEAASVTLNELRNTDDPSQYLNSNLSLSQYTLDDNSDVYCITHKKTLKYTSLTYNFKGYVEIRGYKLTDHEGNVLTWEDDYGNVSEKSPSSAQLAAVIASDLLGEKGYGDYTYNDDENDHYYTKTQKALYYVYSYWRPAVEPGIPFLKDFNSDVFNIQSSVDFPDAEGYAELVKTDPNYGKYNVRIYFFKYSGSREDGEEVYQEMILTQILPDEPDEDYVDIEIQKTWDDKDDILNKRPEDISVTLLAKYKNEQNEREIKTVTLKEPDWKYTFSDLEKYDENGDEITYSVRENNIPESYKVNIEKNDNGEKIEFIIKNSLDITLPDVDGYVIISGKVWVDGNAGKSNDLDGIYNANSDNDNPLSGIKVTLRDKNGDEFTGGSSATTNSSGEYTIIVNYEQSYPYKLYESYDEVYNKLIDGAYVEFEYDGIKYTTVKPLADNSDSENVSKATEDKGERERFDSNNTITNPNSSNTSMITASTIDIIDSFGTYSDVTTEDEKVTTLYCNADGASVTSSSTPPKGTYTQTNPNGAWLEPITTTHDMHSEGNNGHTEWVKTDEVDDEGNPIYVPHYVKPTKWYWCDEGHSLETTTITNIHIKNVNLGLFEREQPDIALTSDIQEVKVTMKGQEYTYIYGNKGIESTDDFFNMDVKFQNKYTYTYRRPVNPADIAYVNNNTDDLKVTVTYKIALKNQSTTLPVTVNKLISYYDSQYTIISSGWNEQGSNNNFSEAISGSLGINIDPLQMKTTTITYDISQNAIKGLLSQEATLNNVVEIYEYSTQYGGETLCAEMEKASNLTLTNGKPKVGSPYAGRDIDSTPGNANVYYDSSQDRLDARTYEDDTDIAPSFVLVKDDEYKIVSGTVWQDTATDESLANNERLGNGIKDSSENLITNVKVELLKVNDDGTTSPAYIYTTENGVIDSREAITYTDSSGHYSFGNNNQEAGQKEGVVTDNYIIKFTYGDDNIDGGEGTTNINGHSINARNYKSTIIIDPLKSDVFEADNPNDKWHLLLKDYTDIRSIAVDDLTERNNIDSESLINGNFDDKKNIPSYSKPFKLQVEYTSEPSANVDVNGGSFEKELSVFNFGIIERARENIVIDKTISNLKITLANGQVLIDGDPYNQKLDYVKALGNTITNRETKPKDKLVSIEIDTELMHGAKIDMTYAITVTNNSEHDYDYTYGDSYYYYGEKESLPLMTTTIEQIVDYVDDEVTVTTDGENENWEIKDWTYLLEKGYIDSTLNPDGTDSNRIENKNYLILTTNFFRKLTTDRTVVDGKANNSDTVYLHVSKLLGNQENEYTYENHVEIIEIGGKIARTIKEVKEDGTQVKKDYIPGNYKPTNASRVHEPDDDRIIARITPPTGLFDNILTYVIIITVSLAVIGTGIIIIKKKVLGK